MAWYLLQKSGDMLSTNHEPLDNRRTEQWTFMDEWAPWSTSGSNNFHLRSKYSDEYQKNFAEGFIFTQSQGSDQSDKFAYCGTTASSDCNTRVFEESSQDLAVYQLQNTEQMDDIFLSQFLDEEMRNMEAPFEALDIFPDSMHRLLSFENMSSTVLTDSQGHMVQSDQNGISTMDTCGFPLFTHDLQTYLENTDDSSPSCVVPKNPEMLEDPTKNKAGVGTIKRRRSVADAENPQCLEAAALEELEDVVIQLTKKTRICFRDAFYRLANSSKEQCTTNGRRITCLSSGCSCPEVEGDDSRVSISEFVEKETNVIDRTVANLTFKLPCSGPQGHESYCIDSQEQGESSWTAKS